MTWLRFCMLYALAHALVEIERKMRRNVFWCWVGVAVAFVGVAINIVLMLLQ